MTAERAALAEPLAVALHGVNQARLRGDEKIVVYGAGPIGLGAVFWLKRRGFKDIVSVDLSEARLAHARVMGAAHTIKPDTIDLKAELIRLHGESAPFFGAPTAATDVFLDMAGAAVLLQQTLEVAKFGARIVLTAVYPTPVQMDLQNPLLREVTLTPAVGYLTELPEVLSVLECVSDEEIGPYVSHRVPFSAFGEAFDAARHPSSAKVIVLYD